VIHIIQEPATRQQREAALLIEWSAPHTPPALHPDLAAAQREILAWQRHWPLDAARPLLALRARQMSEALLWQAGLSGGPAPLRRT